MSAFQFDYIDATRVLIDKFINHANEEGTRLQSDYEACRDLKLSELKRHGMHTDTSESEHLEFKFHPTNESEPHPSFEWNRIPGIFAHQREFRRSLLFLEVMPEILLSCTQQGHLNWGTIQQQTYAKAIIVVSICNQANWLHDNILRLKKRLEELSNYNVEFARFKLDLPSGESNNYEGEPS